MNIVSRVTLTPRTTPPEHWRSGEEFARVLGDTATPLQKVEGDVRVAASVLSPIEGDDFVAVTLSAGPAG